MTSRKKRPIDRRSKPLPHRDARLFVIATEGRKTEKQYFSKFGNRHYQVRVIPNKDDKSAPAHVLQRLRDFKKEFQLKGYDELWLVIDVDRWGDKNLADVATQAVRNSFELAVSNPCFETWLYLHSGELEQEHITSGEMKDKLAKLLGGYSSSKLDLAKFDNVDKAIDRAKALDNTPNERWPTRTGTHVYKLVEKLQGFFVDHAI
ncbi:RloB domain-containing protein [Myxococcota bacterium]|nr:RloB domain-containing protein [Myxococcota bacterium]